MNLLQLESFSCKGGYAGRLSFLLMFLWVMMGCSTVPEDLAVVKGDEIRLGTGIKTRASDTAFERMDRIGLYAVQWADDATSGVLQTAGNYTDNTCFTLLDPEQDWQGTPPVYYPVDSRKLDFYAYYPYRENAFLPGTTSIGLTVQADQRAYANYTASDFVVAKKEGVQRTFDRVNLSFYHKLSQVVFQLKNGDGFTLKQLQGARIKIKNAITDARYNLSAGNFAIPEVGSTHADVIPYGRWSVNPEQDKLVGMKAIVMPQELNMLAYIEITVGERIFYKKFPSPVVLRGGESRVFTITLKNNGGIVPEPDTDCNISTELNPWEVGVPVEGDAEEMGEDIAIVTMTIDVKEVRYMIVEKIGDIVVDWGDGTRDTNIFDHSYVDKGVRTVHFYGNSFALKRLSCYDFGMTSLDVSKSIGLKKLECATGHLTSIDLSNNLALSFLLCADNPLTTLDISNNPAIDTLICYQNQLTTLDISHQSLRNLACGNNLLKTIDLSGHPDLLLLDVSENFLESLNLSYNRNITFLFCRNNKLSTLELTNNSKLEGLHCSNNQLNQLSLSNNPNISDVNCVGNPFLNVISELLNFANSLPNRVGLRQGYVSVSVYGESPDIASTIRPIAESKNWSVR